MSSKRMDISGGPKRNELVRNREKAMARSVHVMSKCDRMRERERFVVCIHTRNTHAHFAQNLRMPTQHKRDMKRDLKTDAQKLQIL